MIIRIAIQIMLLIMTVGAAQAAPRLELSAKTGSAETVVLQVNLTNERGADIAAMGVDIWYDSAALENPKAIAGPAALGVGKGVSASTPAPGKVRLGMLGFNPAAIGNGVVAVVTFTKKPGEKGPLEFKFASSAADPAGNAVTLQRSSGVLTIE